MFMSPDKHKVNFQQEKVHQDIQDMEIDQITLKNPKQSECSTFLIDLIITLNFDRMYYKYFFLFQSKRSVW